MASPLIEASQGIAQKTNDGHNNGIPSLKHAKNTNGNPATNPSKLSSRKPLKWVGYTPSISSVLKRIQRLKENHSYFYMRPLDSASLGHVRVNDRDMIMLGSNNYLGLTDHPKVKKAAIAAIEKYGTGAGGVRILSGTYSIHEKLEEQLATLKDAKAAVVFSSGYATNFGLVSTLAEIGYLIINDEKNHASIIDGCKVRGAQTFFYKHNNVNSLQQTAESLLQKERGKLMVISDGVFSMDGDIVPLQEWLETAKSFNALTMIDDAHATGVLGKSGAGTAEHYGIRGQVDITVGTLSKALAGVGGFIAGSKDLISYIKHTTRAFVFASALPPSVAAACSTAIEVMQSEPEHLQNLWRNRALVYGGLKDMGFNLGHSETPIIPVIVGDEFLVYEYARRLDEAGIYVNPVAYPAVRKQEARLRITVTAALTPKEIGTALSVFKTIAKTEGTSR